MRLESPLQDLRFATRMLVKHPLLSLAVIVTFSFGIGLASTAFNITNGFIPDDLPFEQVERILVINRTAPSRNIEDMGVDAHDLVDWRRQQDDFEQLAAYTSTRIDLAAAPETMEPGESPRPQRYYGARFTPGVFEALGVQPVLGRTFRQEEGRPGADPVIIIGYDVWQGRFDGAHDVLGQRVLADGVPHTIVGVMPQGFRFPDIQRVWIPLEIDPSANPRGEGSRYTVIGRLRDGVTRSQAEARLEAIAAGLEQTNPESNEGVRPTFRTLRQALAPPALSALFYSMVAAAFGVLLIGCTNVANLLLARAAARTQEVAVRCALGASRSRVVVLLMSEVSILALIGGGIGFLLGHLGLRWFLVQVDYVLAVAGGGEEFPFWVSFEHDIRVVLFVILATATASVLAGLFPALKASATNVADAMKGAGRGEAGLRMARFSGGLIVAEVALSCVLLVLAGLFIRSITQLNNVELNYATENVYTARLELPESDYPDSSSRLLFFEELLSELRAIPGVETASLSDSLPPFHVGARSIEVEGEIYEDEHSFPIVRSGVITSDYFHTFETPLLLGRALSAMDRGGTSLVAVINESFARAYFPGDSALGRRFRTHFSDGPGDWLEVVGVVPDLKAFPMEADGVSREAQNPACFYVPLGQADPGRYMVMVLRTQGPPTSIADEVRNVVASLDSQLALFMELPMDGVILRMIWFYPVFSSVFMTFGFGALFLAAVGLYGMMSFAVAQRTREMGVRLALGAQRGQLVALVMRKGLIRIGIGLGLGLVFALLASAPLALLLFEVQGRDPAVIAMVVVTLAVTGLIACFIPARRVTSVDPATALGSE